jgi:hypothetical protein
MGSQDIPVANTAGFFANLPDAEFVNVFRCESLLAFFQRSAKLADAGSDFLLPIGMVMHAVLADDIARQTGLSLIFGRLP